MRRGAACPEAHYTNKANTCAWPPPYSSRAEPIDDIKTLADLIDPERFKTVLRHYLGDNGQAKAFVISVSKTLIQVAYYYVSADPEQIAKLKFLASKLPSIPHRLTAKNRAL